MPLPITPTPVLKGQEAIDFYEKIEREKNIKVPLVPTPKLEALKQELIRRAKEGK